MYAWSEGDPVCSLSTTLVGNGKASLDFGNCWSDGIVKVYLDGIEIGFAKPEESQLASFSYTDGSKLEVKELNTGIIQLNKFEFI